MKSDVDHLYEKARAHLLESAEVKRQIAENCMDSILAAAAMPSVDGTLSEARLSAAADQAITALGFAQLAAMNTGRETKVTFDVTTDTILVEQFTNPKDLLGAETELDEADVEGGAFEPMGNPLNRGTDYSIDLAARGWVAGAEISAADFSGNDFVTFDALGTPSSEGTVTLVVGKRQQRVRVRRFTGRAVLLD